MTCLLLFTRILLFKVRFIVVVNFCQMLEETNDDNDAVQWYEHCPLGVGVSQFWVQNIKNPLQEQFLGKMEHNELLP